MGWVDSTQTYTDTVTPEFKQTFGGGVVFGKTSSDQRQTSMYVAAAVVAVALILAVVMSKRR